MLKLTELNTPFKIYFTTQMIRVINVLLRFDEKIEQLPFDESISCQRWRAMLAWGQKRIEDNDV